MAHEVARLGDTSDHGGEIVSASQRMTVDGRFVARVGDLFSCPTHGVNPIVSSPAEGDADESGKTIAVIGSVCECGAIITSGSEYATMVSK